VRQTGWPRRAELGVYGASRNTRLRAAVRPCGRRLATYVSAASVSPARRGAEKARAFRHQRHTSRRTVATAPPGPHRRSAGSSAADLADNAVHFGIFDVDPRQIREAVWMK